MTRLTDDQRVLLKHLAKGSLFEGAVPLYTGLSEARGRVVADQLAKRGLIERRRGQLYTLRLTPKGRKAEIDAHIGERGDA